MAFFNYLNSKKDIKSLWYGFILMAMAAFVYLIFQFNTIAEDEAALTSIYQKQLETILFSVNQFSNDNLATLAAKIEQQAVNQPSNQKEMHATKYFINDVILNTSIVPLQDGYWQVDQEMHPEAFIQLIAKNEKQLRMLVEYHAGGYRKIEPLGMIDIQDRQAEVVSFIMSVKDTTYLFCWWIDPIRFTEEILSPKMQQIADEELVLYVRNPATREMIYQTDSIYNAMMIDKRMWLFPELNIGVSPKGIITEVIINRRIRSNLIAILILIVLLIVSLWVISYNIRKALALAKNKSDFVSNVSHELRTPLALISMFSESLMLERITDQVKAKQYLETIYREAQRLSGIVNRILNFSKMEAGKRTYYLSPIEINELVQQVINDYQYHISQQGFQLTYQLLPSAHYIMADKEAIYEALVILIDNATKYSPDEKSIQIEVFSENQGVLVSVSDKGIGISSQEQKPIFEKFYRVLEGNLQAARGAGLGLTLLKHIMDAHNGRVDVFSSLGKGSTFKLWFPIHIRH